MAIADFAAGGVDHMELRPTQRRASSELLFARHAANTPKRPLDAVARMSRFDTPGGLAGGFETSFGELARCP